MEDGEREAGDAPEELSLLLRFTDIVYIRYCILMPSDIVSLGGAEQNLFKKKKKGPDMQKKRKEIEKPPVLKIP